MAQQTIQLPGSIGFKFGSIAAAPTAMVSASEIVWLWTAPADGVPEITGYDVQWRIKGNQFEGNLTENHPSTTFRLRGATANTDYEVRVRAVYSIGRGQWSPTGAAHTLDATVNLQSPASVTEGVNFTVSATLNSTLSADASIPITWTWQTDQTTSGQNLPTSISILAGNSAGTVTANIGTDTSAADESIVLSLGSPLPAGVIAGATTSISISGDDPSPPPAPPPPPDPPPPTPPGNHSTHL